MLDDIQTAYFDNTIRQHIPKQPWMAELTRTDDPNSWGRKATEHLLRNEQYNNGLITKLMKETNHSSSIFTYQKMYGCELNDDRTTAAFWKNSFHGEDFGSFDREQGLFTAVAEKAQIREKVCNIHKSWGNYIKDYLEKECIEWLKKHILYGKEILEQKVAPEVRVYNRPGSERNSVALTCMATGFYPRTIDMTWVRDGETQMDDAHTDGILPNEDETYQMRKTIEIDLEDKHSYTCWVDHNSLEKQLSVTLAPSPGVKSGITVPVVVVILVLILVLLITGFVIWRKKKPGVKKSDYTPAQRREAEDSSSNTSSN
nr:PREDICTED: major histocompatibility complex class I-related gene protein-like [Latimeria chalumnae]|eukprot:XP_014353354.1 PREDICTED: major histocompatibility complex class I-related gene protein-like [Latimeria chalumnae]